MYLKFGFIIAGFLLFALLCIYKLVISKRKRTDKTSIYVSVMGAVLGIYVLCGVFFAIFAPTNLSKLIIAIFTLSPFIIGKVATYEKENFYSFLQIFCIAMSLFYSFSV